MGFVSSLEQVGRGDSCWWVSSSRDENLLAQGKGGLWGFCFVGFFKKKKLWRRQEMERAKPERPLVV